MLLPRLFKALARMEKVPSRAKKVWLHYWLESGDHMRQEADSDLVLAQALKKILPPYRGDGLRLYRGESMFNRRRHTYGLSWTSDIEVAKSFAEGIYQTFDGGSVLLQTDAPASAIICIPKQHTAWRDGESEYLVDRRKLTLVTVLERYVQRDLNSP